jgi:hypothetical protein
MLISAGKLTLVAMLPRMTVVRTSSSTESFTAQRMSGTVNQVVDSGPNRVDSVEYRYDKGFLSVGEGPTRRVDWKMRQTSTK